MPTTWSRSDIRCSGGRSAAASAWDSELRLNTSVTQPFRAATALEAGLKAGATGDTNASVTPPFRAATALEAGLKAGATGDTNASVTPPFRAATALGGRPEGRRYRSYECVGNAAGRSHMNAKPRAAISWSGG